MYFASHFDTILSNTINGIENPDSFYIKLELMVYHYIIKIFK